MIKARKILAMVLATVMMMSLFVCTAFASEELDITYWNADSSKIILDFSEEVDVSALTSAITLTKNGADVTFTVVKKAATPEPQFSSKTSTFNNANSATEYAHIPMTADTDVTYVIIPQGGVELDAPYFLTVNAGLASVDGAVTLRSDFAKGFKVKKIFKEDYNNYTTSTMPRNKGSIETDSDLGSPVLKQTSAYSLFKGAGTDNFGDSGKTYSEFKSTLAAYSEYTVAAKVKVTDTTKSHGFGFNMRSHDDTSYYQYTDMLTAGIIYDETSGKGYAAMLGKASADDTDDPWSYAVTSTAKMVDNRIALPTDTSGAVTDATKIANMDLPVGGSTPYSSSEYVDVSLTLTYNDTAKNIKFFAGDDFFSYDFILTIGKHGLPGILTYNASSSYPIYVEDLIMTYVEECVASAYTMTPADGSENVAIGDTVSLAFADDVDEATVSVDTIKVYKNDELFTDYTVSVNEDDATVVDIKFNSSFENSTEYTIVPDGVGYVDDDTSYVFNASSFTTVIPDVEFSTFSAGDGVDMSALTAGTYSVSAVFENNKITDGVAGVITICLYDSNMRMIDVAVKAIDVDLNENDTISDTWTITESGAYTAKCYVWDSFDDMGLILEGTLE